MTIQEKMRNDLKEAMRSKDSEKLGVIKSLSAAFINELVSQKRMPNEALSDEDAINVMKRAAKQRKDSIKQFEDGGRPELAENEKKELAIIETYLPEQMSENEIEVVVKKKIKEMGMSDKSKMGILVGAVMKEIGANADGQVVKQVVEKLLS